MSWVIRQGVKYLTGFAGADAWSANPVLAMPFTDWDAVQRQAARINGLRLGNTKAIVEVRATHEA